MLSKEEFEKLIKEDMKWLKNNTPNCLERNHILCILKDAPNLIYPEPMENYTYEDEVQNDITGISLGF